MASPADSADVLIPDPEVGTGEVDLDKFSRTDGTADGYQCNGHPVPNSQDMIFVRDTTLDATDFVQKDFCVTIQGNTDVVMTDADNEACIQNVLPVEILEEGDEVEEHFRMLDFDPARLAESAVYQAGEALDLLSQNVRCLVTMKRGKKVQINYTKQSQCENGDCEVSITAYLDYVKVTVCSSIMWNFLNNTSVSKGGECTEKKYVKLREDIQKVELLTGIETIVNGLSPSSVSIVAELETFAAQTV